MPGNCWISKVPAFASFTYVGDNLSESQTFVVQIEDYVDLLP